MDIPSSWRDYPCSDYFECALAQSGWFDESGEYWYIEPATRVTEDADVGLLVIGGPGVDGILWGYRKAMPGVWAYYPIDGEFVWLAESATALRQGYASGEITV
jgi:hypothetical protein